MPAVAAALTPRQRALPRLLPAAAGRGPAACGRRQRLCCRGRVPGAMPGAEAAGPPRCWQRGVAGSPASPRATEPASSRAGAAPAARRRRAPGPAPGPAPRSIARRSAAAGGAPRRSMGQLTRRRRRCTGHFPPARPAARRGERGVGGCGASRHGRRAPGCSVWAPPAGTGGLGRNGGSGRTRGSRAPAALASPLPCGHCIPPPWGPSPPSLRAYRCGAPPGAPPPPPVLPGPARGGPGGPRRWGDPAVPCASLSRLLLPGAEPPLPQAETMPPKFKRHLNDDEVTGSVKSERVSDRRA